MQRFTTKKETAYKRPLRWGLFSLIWLIIWQICAGLCDSSLLLPSPIETVTALAGLALTKTFYLDILWTIGRCLLAMLLSFITGAILSWCAYRLKTIEALLSLPVAFFKAVPVMAIIIYVILLMDSDWVAVVVCFFMCFPVVYTNLLEGLKSCGNDFLELAKVCRLSRGQTIRLVYIPGLLPQIKASISLISGLSWKAVVAAEVLSIPRYSLGYEMMNAKYYLETANLFGYIIIIVFLSLAFERIVKRWMGRLEWKPYINSKVERFLLGQKQNVKNGTNESADCPPPKVKIENLTKAFDEKKVFSHISMTFPRGKVTALMGPSGRGKTTLLRMIADFGLLPDEGFVLIDEPRQGKIAVLFQEDRLLPWLTVYDNMMLAMMDRGLNSIAAEREVKEMARDLELEQALFQLPSQLSGGMRSRVALGRTFLMNGKLILLDEPFKGLDQQLKERIIGRLWEKQTLGRTVILVTHDEKDAQWLADQVIPFPD